jgi:uncharacterized protein
VGKALFWIVVIIGGLLVARILARQNARAKMAAQQPRQAPRRSAAPIDHPESMVQCAHCGIHLPRSEAVLSHSRTWCSQEHAKLGVRQ